mmetsp:Transcript_27387/g.64163  ORF Transcript_27387/g.64163 Transcript_27387/m.64163 type:complete len:228 (+) Transcript_27387:1862-2545(+)
MVSIVVRGVWRLLVPSMIRCTLVRVASSSVGASREALICCKFALLAISDAAREDLVDRGLLLSMLWFSIEFNSDKISSFSRRLIASNPTVPDMNLPMVLDFLVGLDDPPLSSLVSLETSELDAVFRITAVAAVAFVAADDCRWLIVLGLRCIFANLVQRLLELLSVTVVDTVDILPGVPGTRLLSVASPVFLLLAGVVVVVVVVSASTVSPSLSFFETALYAVFPRR